MMFSKLSVQQMLTVLEDLKAKNFEFFDMEGVNHENQDAVKIFIQNKYLKISKQFSTELNDNIINTLLQ